MTPVQPPDDLARPGEPACGRLMLAPYSEEPVGGVTCQRRSDHQGSHYFASDTVRVRWLAD